jgi:hypothetical protein
MDTNDIFLGTLPTMVQGDEPLGVELITKLEKYTQENKLPSFEIFDGYNGDSVAKMVGK